MVKVLSLFSGIGAFEKALANLNIDYETVNYCEIDKYASTAYAAIHDIGEDKNLGDITKVNAESLADFDLMTWGFPCQDISVAGSQKGIVEGETRSGLYHEGYRIMEAKRPKYSIIENVKNLVGKKFRVDFEKMLADIEALGYNNYWQVLNAKDYGIPQNRERVFIVSIRKDIDEGGFEFPKPFDNGIRLKHVLESEVDEKFYISQNKAENVIAQLNVSNASKDEAIAKSPSPELVGGIGEINFGKQYRQGNRIYSAEKTAMCLMAQPVGNAGGFSYLYAIQEPAEIKMVGMLDIKGNEQVRRVYDPEGLSPTLNTMQGGNRQPKIIEEIENE